MRIEWLVAFYMFVSLSMTAFNFAYLLKGKTHALGLERRGERLARRVGELLDGEQGPTPRSLVTLERIMGRLSGLESFNRAMELLEREDPERSRRVLQAVAPVLARLSQRYDGGSVLRCTYYSFIIRRWYSERPAGPVIEGSLLKIVRTSSFYARQSALAALAEVGSAESLAEAVVLLEGVGSFHHPKLVTEALLAFPGSRQELADRLVARFDEFRPEMQAAVINFGRMADIEHLDSERYARRREWVRGMMVDPSLDEEVRLACVRYFTRHPWEEVAEPLRYLAACEEPDKWEYAAVAASALAGYPGPETVAVLKRCLSSRAWYVRRNAAKSLCDMGLELEDLRDVLEGDDRYARDMVLFRWEEDRGVRLGEGVSP